MDNKKDYNSNPLSHLLQRNPFLLATQHLEIKPSTLDAPYQKENGHGLQSSTSYSMVFQCKAPDFVDSDDDYMDKKPHLGNLMKHCLLSYSSNAIPTLALGIDGLLLNKSSFSSAGKILDVGDKSSPALASADLFNLSLPEGIYSRLHTWTSKLVLIEAVLSDAEEKQITAKSVNMWLQQLQDLAYDLDDLLDELATEALRRRLMMAQPTQASNPSMFRKLIPACCSTNLTPRAVQFDLNISSEIDNITERLEDLLKQKSGLNLMSDHLGGTRSRRTGDERPPSTSLVDEYSGFYGRGEDKQAILAQMCLGCESGSDRRFRVIPIV
ncbi:hypothetical protein RJ640_017512, partial [Escallonia rubra]